MGIFPPYDAAREQTLRNLMGAPAEPAERRNPSDNAKPVLDQGHKYRRRVYGTDTSGSGLELPEGAGCVIADVYDVLDAFATGSSALDHAVKKILCAGQRGHKDRLKDLREATWSIDRAIQNEIRRGANDAK